MSYNRDSSSLRYRSGSVERRSTTNSSTSSSRDPAPYRTSYGTERGRPRDLPTTITRMSRATSYDPFASSNRASSVIRTGGLSNSDYTPRIGSYTSRYGSTEQLNSSSTSTSSYRPSSYRSGSITSGSGSSNNSTSSSYTPRNVRAGSVSIGAYDPPRSSSHSDSVSTFSSRYRPPDNPISSYTPSLSRYRSTDLSSTSDYSTSKYRSPENSYSSSRCSSTVSNRYSSSNKPSSAYSSRTSTSSSYRSDRDYRSMSRTTDNEEEVDEVESTFRKLYRKYVTDSEPDLTKTGDKEEESLAQKVSRRFESSKSEAESDDNSISEEDEEDEILTKYQAKGLRRASSASSITPRASVCNSPSKDVTPKCSPLPARKELPKSPSRSVSPEMKPLTRSFQMEATFGISAVAKRDSDDVPKLVDMSSSEDEEDQEESTEEEEKVPEVKPLEPIKKVASSIKINGIAVKDPEPTPEDVTKKEDVGPVRIRIRSDRSPSRTKELPPTSENLISSAVKIVLNHSEKPESPPESSESDTTTTSSRASTLRKRRDPNRTLENLQSILKAEKMNEEKKEILEENNVEVENKEEKETEKKIRRIPIPLVLITEPSNPSTPLVTTPVATAASICLWNNTDSTKRNSSSTEDDEEYDEDEEEYSSGDWTEGEDDEEYITDEEEEFSVSQTFSLKDHINLRELYPLATSTSNTSALVSEFDGDSFLADTRKEESRGRVDSLFAVPAPTFTCSVTYDGMMPGEEDDDEWGSDEVHSCEEGDDEDFRVLPIVRPGSSSLGAYMSPGSMTSDDESGSNYDGRTVGCTLKLVDRAARKDSEDSEESEYYDDEEEEIEDESEEYEDEEYWDEEIEYEDEEEFEYEDEEVLEEYVDEEEEEEEEETMKSVESSEEEEEMSVMMESESHELFVTPPIKLMTESLVEEMIEEACYGEIPEETLFALNEVEVEDYTLAPAARN